MSRVLLTDGQQRKTLVAARSLGRAGWRVLVADETRCSLSRFSRHCSVGLLCPPPESAGYAPWLVRRAAAADVLLPMDDFSSAAAISVADDIRAASLLPTADQFSTCRDKLRTVELADRAGVPHPRTVAIGGPEEIPSALAKLGGGAVLRPRFGSGGRGVQFLRSGAPLPATLPAGGCFLQERLPLGRKYDVGLLYDRDGALRAYFAQEELRWFPAEQGASTLQRSVWRPDLVERAVAVLAPIGWVGPVEVEFMIAQDGEPRLLEVNPRFWASLGLAVAAGVDFPRLAAELAQGRRVEVPAGYRTDLVCRWSLPADILHALRHPLRDRGEGGPLVGEGEERIDDILSWDDPAPVLGFALAALRYSLDRRMWRHLLRR